MSFFAEKSVTRLSPPILVTGFLIGLLLSLSVLSGDASGRVNLLYLLIVFLFIPLVGAALSTLSLFGKKGINLAQILSLIPIWSKTQKHFLYKIRQRQLDKQWFFLQSQGAALAYSTASLLVFIILLLATDINFVWRSTVLNAEQLLPLLSLIAAPWSFWDLAQPSLELLRTTQDSRLTQTYVSTTRFGQWWAFVFATQLVYCFFLRGLLLAVAHMWVQRGIKIDVEPQQAHLDQTAQVDQSDAPVLAAITHHLPERYALNNWAGISSDMLSQLSLTPNQELLRHPTSLDQYAGQQLVLVKAWEPPLGELQDYMQCGQGLIFPINYTAESPIAPEKKHLEEWQRFVKLVPNWRIYLPSKWIT